MILYIWKKKPPHQHKDGWRKGFTLSIKYFSVIIVNIFLHKLYVFQFIDNGDKNNFVKLLQSEACNIPRFICLLWCHWPLFWTPGIEQTRFSPYRASVSSPLHNLGKMSNLGNTMVFSFCQKKGGKSICMYEHFQSIFLQRYMRDNLD